jgi:hypothetical protein
MMQRFLKALEEYVQTDEDRLCFDSITLGLDIMSYLSEDESDDMS